MRQKIVVQVDQELKDLIPTYLTNRKVELEELRKFCAARDSKSIHAITHKIKGNAAAYGFVTLGTVAVEIELALKSDQWEMVTKKLNEIEHYLAHLKIQYIEVKE